MSTIYYNTKIDWWVPVLVLITVSLAFIGPIIDGEIFLCGIIVGCSLGILEILLLRSVKYQINDGRLGIRNIFYSWDWYPIDKIVDIRKTTGFLSAPSLSTKRIAITFSEKKIMKSIMPLEISPKNREAFIANLKEINPQIITK